MRSRTRRGESDFGREVLVNLALGLGISALLFAIRDLPRFRDVEDASLDWFIQVRRADLATFIEWQVPLLEQGIAPRKAFDPFRLKLATFFDSGAWWDNDDALTTSDTRDLCSLGLLWDPSPATQSEL